MPTPYSMLGWQLGTGPKLHPGLLTMDQGIWDAHQYAGLSVDTFSALRAQNAPVTAGVTREVMGASAVGDGGGGLFYYSTSSSATDDSRNILKPDSVGSGSPGRWIRRDLADGPTLLANNAALRALTSSQMPDLVLVRGYYTTADGGEGIFWRDTSLTGYAFTAAATTDQFTVSAHPFTLGERIRFTGGSLPGGITAGTDYWVTDVTTNTFKVAATRMDATTYASNPVNISADGSGTANFGDNGGTLIVDAAGARWRRVYVGGSYQVDWFGAKGDGTQIDTLYIDNAIQAAKVAGVRVVEFNSKKSYALNRRVSTQQQPSIQMRENISLEGNGCELVMKANAAFMGSDWLHWTGAPAATVTGAVTYGTKTLTVNSTTGLSVGDELFIRLGQSEYDPVETIHYLRAYATALTSTTITLDKPILASISSGDLTAASQSNKNVGKLYDFPKDGFARNFRLRTDAGAGGDAEGGVDLRYSKNYLLENIHGNNTSIHVLAYYPENVKVRNCGAVNQINATSHSSKGRIFTVLNANGIDFENCYGEYFQKCFAFLEFYCRGVRLRNSHIIENHPSVDSSQGIFVIAQGAEASIENTFVEASGTIGLVAEGGTDVANHYRFRNTTLRYLGGPAYVARNTLFEGDLVYQYSGSTTDPHRTTTAEFQLSNTQEYSYYIPLVNSMSFTEEVFAPPGLLLAIYVYTSPNITVNTHLTGVYVGRSGSAGSDLRSSLVPGTTVGREHALGYNDAPATAYTSPVMASVGTAASGVSSNDMFLIVKALVAPYDWRPNQAYTAAAAKRMHGIV